MKSPNDGAVKVVVKRVDPSGRVLVMEVCCV